MKVTVTKITDKGLARTEYDAKGVKYSGGLLAIDIVGLGWRTIQAKDFDSFTIEQ